MLKILIYVQFLLAIDVVLSNPAILDPSKYYHAIDTSLLLDDEDPTTERNLEEVASTWPNLPDTTPTVLSDDVEPTTERNLEDVNSTWPSPPDTTPSLLWHDVDPTTGRNLEVVNSTLPSSPDTTPSLLWDDVHPTTERNLEDVNSTLPSPPDTTPSLLWDDVDPTTGRNLEDVVLSHPDIPGNTVISTANQQGALYLTTGCNSECYQSSKKNYVYRYKAGGWMKLHTNPATWQEAFKKCAADGAVLASPLNKPLASTLHAMMINAVINTGIHLGTHSLYADSSFVSLEGVPLNDMYIKWGPQGCTGDGKCLTMNRDTEITMSTSPCTERLPYICYKKRENDVNYNECGTFHKNYHLNEKTGSCYKLHKEAKSWTQAYGICVAEGGYLVIINDDEEASIIKAMVPNGTNNYVGDKIFIGLRDLFEDKTWLTIHGERLEDVFHKWAPGAPNNYDNHQACGSLRHAGDLDDSGCEDKLWFVCEKDPRIKQFQDYDPEKY